MAAVPVLADDDLHALDDGALLDRTAQLIRERNRIDAELARTLRVADARRACEHDGLKTMPSWLRNHTRLSAAAAAQLVRCGRALEHLPALATAFAAGDVTADQVAVVAPIAREERLAAAAEQGVDLAEIATALTVIATAQPHQVLGQAVDRYLAMLDQDGPEPDPTEGRRLVIVKHADGSGTGRFDLDAVGLEKVQTALEAVLQASRCAADERTRQQQQADAFVQLCNNQLASGNLPVLRGHKPQIIVTINAEDLFGPGTNPGAGEMGFGATISAARARWLACDGAVTRIVMGPDGMPLDHGRTLRLVPPHVRRAAEVRDGGCVFTGCGAPTFWCDVHHLLAWIDGGETSLDNSALLCERHHTKVHHGFRVERQPDGRWRTWRPDGTEILIGPQRTGPGRTGPPLTTAA